MQEVDVVGLQEPGGGPGTTQVEPQADGRFVTPALASEGAPSTIMTLTFKRKALHRASGKVVATLPVGIPMAHEHDHDHEDLFDELLDHFQPVLDHCPQGVNLWIDDENSVCNEALAELFGMTVDDWSAPGSFLERFVAPEDREMFSKNYAEHVANLAGPVRFRFKAVRKDGKTFDAETDMIPITFGGHAVAYHFVRKV